MDHIKNLNIDDNNNKSIKKIEFDSESKEESNNSNEKGGYRYKKKILNSYKKKEKEKEKLKDENIEILINKEEINQKLNKSSENLSSSDIFNLNIQHQDPIPMTNNIKSNNLNMNSLDSDSDLDFNLLKDSKININEDNNKNNEQKIPSIIDGVKPNDKAIIVNAIYFYGKWLFPISDDDIVIGKNDLSESLYKALLEVKNARRGKGKLLDWEEFKREMER